jgi:hypothetical protein
MEELAGAELMLYPLRGPTCHEIIKGRDYIVEPTVPPAMPWGVWFVFEEASQYWGAIDALHLVGIKPLVMDDIVSVRLRRERLGLPAMLRP